MLAPSQQYYSSKVCLHFLHLLIVQKSELISSSFAFYFVIRKFKAPKRPVSIVLIRGSYNMGSSSPVLIANHREQSFITPLRSPKGDETQDRCCYSHHSCQYLGVLYLGPSKTSDLQKIHLYQRQMGQVRESHLPLCRRCIELVFHSHCPEETCRPRM